MAAVYSDNISAMYYYIVEKNDTTAVIYNSNSYETWDHLNRSKVSKYRCVKCSLNHIQTFNGVDYVNPDIIFDKTNQKIIIPRLCSHNLYNIKCLVDQIRRIHKTSRENTPLVIHYINVQSADKTVLLEIFEGAIVHLSNDYNKILHVTNMCNFMFHADYKFKALHCMLDANGDFILDNSCTTLSAKNVSTSCLNSIVVSNPYLNHVKIDTLNIDMIYTVDPPVFLNSLNTFNVEALDIPYDDAGNNIKLCIKYLGDLLNIHQASIETINIPTKYFHHLWNDLVKRKVQWVKLKEVRTLATDMTMHLAMPKDHYLFPNLTRFIMEKRDLSLVCPSVKSVCTTHDALQDSKLEDLAFMMARNRKNRKAAMAWLIFNKFHLKHLSIVKDIAIKIAHMVIETNTSDMEFEYRDLKSADFDINYTHCYDIENPCNIHACISPHELKLWDEIDIEIARVNRAKGIVHNANNAINKMSRTIDNNFKQIEDLKVKISKKQDRIKEWEEQSLKADESYERAIKKLKR